MSEIKSRSVTTEGGTGVGGFAVQPEQVTSTVVPGDKNALDGYIKNPVDDPVNVNLVSPDPVEALITNDLESSVPVSNITAEHSLAAICSKLDMLEMLINLGLGSNSGVNITSAAHGSKASVTPRGQLVTAPLDFSIMYDAFAGTDDVAVNVVVPRTGKQFVVTDIILTSNRNVGLQGATVTLFESDSITSDTQLAVVLQQEIAKQTTLSLTGLNIILSTGVWLNVITDDDDVFANIGGYYVDAL